MNVETLKEKLQNITGNHNLNDYSYGYYTACSTEETNELELLCLWFNEHPEGSDIIVPIETLPQDIIKEALDFNFCLYIKNKSEIEGSKFYLFNSTELKALPALVYNNLIRDENYTDFTLFFKGEPVNITCLYQCNDNDMFVSFRGIGGIENDVVSDRINMFEEEIVNKRFGEYHWVIVDEDADYDTDGVIIQKKISETNVIWEDINYCEFGIIGVFAVVEGDGKSRNYSAVNGGKESVFKNENEAIEYCEKLAKENPDKHYVYVEGNSIFKP